MNPPSGETQRDSGWGPAGLTVLNPGGSDPDQPFPDHAGTPEAAGHPPVNFHAYAACTGGRFLKNSHGAPPGSPVLLLLRRDLKRALKAVQTLLGDGHPVAVSLKEAGGHQVAALLDDPKRLTLFREICTRAGLCLAATPELVPFYLGAGARRAEFIPTPYPVESEAWDFSRPVTERRGVFIGTREFDVPSRNHLAALWTAKSLGKRVTVVNTRGRPGRRRLEALGFGPKQLRIVEGPMPYPDYLRLMAGHRIVFQLDRSAVPGQVAGDALLCRVPCVGGDSAIERLAFPDLSGFCREPSELIRQATRLLKSDLAYRGAIAQSQRLALETLSFTAVAGRLHSFFLPER